jgi:hypothetical protein
MVNMIYKNKNFSRLPLDIAKDGDVFEGCNLSQEKASTSVSTVKGLVFHNCNLVNVKIEPSWTVDGDCNIFQGDFKPDIIDPLQAEKSAIEQRLIDEIREKAIIEMSKISDPRLLTYEAVKTATLNAAKAMSIGE